MEVYKEGDNHYAIGFLINAKQNHAADPESFKVSKANLMRIAKTAIGRPWLPGKPKGQNLKHFRTPPATSIQSYRENKKKHIERARGIITDIIPNAVTGNISVIVKLTPEYAQKIESHKVSPFLSPMLTVFAKDPRTDEIIDGEIIHLHSVDESGYSPEIAHWYGTCKGAHQECKTKLQTLAASGSPHNTHNTLIRKSSEHSKMSAQPQQPPGMPDTVIPPAAAAPGMEGGGDINEVKSLIVQIGEELQHVEDVVDQNFDITKQAVAAAGVDVSKFQMCKPQQAGMPDAADPAMPPAEPQAAMGGHKMMGAAGGSTPTDQRILKMEQQVAAMKKQLADKDAKIASDSRKKMAQIIAKGEIAIRIDDQKKEDYAKIVEKYFNMKHPNNPNELADLTLFAAHYEKVLNSLTSPPATPTPIVAAQQTAAAQTPEVPLVVAASGYLYGSQPTPKTTKKFDYDKMEDAIQ